MSVKAYLKQIGRGSKGASDLSRSDAAELFTQILSRGTSALELGAFCMAMRLKGETAQELIGFYEALKPFLPSLRLSKPVWLVPSYNGARKTPLLTPLLAKMLTDKGYFVLVHGAHEEPQRTSSEQVFTELHWPVTKTLSELPALLEHQGFAYCPLSVLCPSLSQLLTVRQVLGLRNTGHVLAKLLNPFQSEAFQLSNYTHPAYPMLLDEFYKHVGANVVTMRGHEGEPVASPRRLPELHLRFNHSESAEVIAPQYFDAAPETRGAVEAAGAPEDISSAATAAHYQKMFSQQEPFPPSLVAQVDVLDRAYRAAPQPSPSHS
jgi:anthranilate phosphoribosyltransferase